MADQPPDPLLDAVAPALTLAGEIQRALVRLAERRAAGWPTPLVSTALDDAVRLHSALASSLERLCRITAPAMLVANGQVEPSVPAATSPPRAREGAEPETPRDGGHVP